jgi:hypothetical protein
MTALALANARGFAFGVSPQLSNFASYMNGPGCGVVIGQIGWQLFDNDVSIAGPVGFVDGAQNTRTMQCAYDGIANSFYFGYLDTWLNGSDPVAGTGGRTPTNTPSFIALDLENNITGFWRALVNFGGQPFVGTIPSGFVSVDPPASSTMGLSGQFSSTY